jgi:hypothetical protein
MVGHAEAQLAMTGVGNKQAALQSRGAPVAAGRLLRILSDSGELTQMRAAFGRQEAGGREGAWSDLAFGHYLFAEAAHGLNPVKEGATLGRRLALVSQYASGALSAP